MPEAINLGPLLLPTRPFGVLLSLFASMWLVSRIAQSVGLETRWTTRVAENTVWIGLIGSRLGFVLKHWSAYEAAPWTALYVWQPGYLWWTGVATGSAYAMWCLAKRAAEERYRYVGVLAGGFAGGGVLLTAWLGSAILLADPEALRNGDTVPDFTLSTLEGKRVSFSSLAGQIVVLNFWATWCPPCRREMPLLDDIHKTYSPHGVSVVGIDVGEPPDLVKEYTSTIGVDYPIWVDALPPNPEADRTATVYERFGGVGFPTTFFVDHTGVIRDAHVGELSRGLLQSRIDYLMAKRKRSSTQ